jgi:hypothetical protein
MANSYLDFLDICAEEKHIKHLLKHFSKSKEDISNVQGISWQSNLALQRI